MHATENNLRIDNLFFFFTGSHQSDILQTACYTMVIFTAGKSNKAGQTKQTISALRSMFQCKPMSPV